MVIKKKNSHPLYIDALNKILTKCISSINWKPDLIIASYHCHCHKTTRLLEEKFKKKIPFLTTFQSKFEPEEWLKPYTEVTLIDLGENKKKNVVVKCPGFSSDCIETLEEKNIRAKQVFLENRGETS